MPHIIATSRVSKDLIGFILVLGVVLVRFLLCPCAYLFKTTISKQNLIIMASLLKTKNKNFSTCRFFVESFFLLNSTELKLTFHKFFIKK